MDEPTNHLDIKHQIEILTIVKSLDISTIACIHDINLALAICDEIICIDKGTIAFQKPVEDIIEDDLEKVYGVECRLDMEPFHNRPRLSVRWSS